MRFRAGEQPELAMAMRDPGKEWRLVGARRRGSPDPLFRQSLGRCMRPRSIPASDFPSAQGPVHRANERPVGKGSVDILDPLAGTIRLAAAELRS